MYTCVASRAIFEAVQNLKLLRVADGNSTWFPGDLTPQKRTTRALISPFFFFFFYCGDDTSPFELSDYATECIHAKYILFPRRCNPAGSFVT